MLRNSIKFLFLVYIISLFTISEHETLYIYSNLCFFIFLVFSVINMLYKGKIIVNNAMLTLILFDIYLIASCFWVPNLSDALTRVATVIQLLIMLFMIYNSFSKEELIDFLVRCLWFGGLSLCILFLSKYSMIEIIESYATKFRLGEKIAPLNAVGRNLAIFVVINVYYVLIQEKYGYVIPCVLGIFIMSTTQSRTALLISFAGVATIAAFKIRESKLFRVAGISIMILAVIFISRSSIIHAMFWRVYKMFLFLIDTSNMDIDYSAYVRFGLLKKGIDFILKNPLWGYGVASGYYLLDGTYFHNNYIQLGVEMGIIGLILYYMPMLYVVYKALKRPKDKGNIFAVALLTMILVGDFVNSTYYHKMTYVMLGIAMCVVQKAKKDGKIDESC